MGGDEGRLHRVHSVRVVSTFIAFMRNWSVTEVLEVASWRSNHVVSYYRKSKKSVISSIVPWQGLLIRYGIIDLLTYDY